MTWDELVRLEPRLLDLEREVRAIRDDKRKPSFCANAVWLGYGIPGLAGLKLKMTRLVGWEARGKAEGLHTERAYDVAYSHLYGLLPDCRNCGCIQG